MVRRSIVKDLAVSEKMLAEFFKNSYVGLAIFDRRLCYRGLNPYLAASNGTTIEAHLGKHVEEILGNMGRKVGAAINKVFATRRPVLNCEFAGAFPTRPQGGRWIDTFFPIADSTGRVEQVGAVVVELEADKQLQIADEPMAVSSGVLRSWKDIAHYVGTCVKTVQRWEREHEFPVRRVTPGKGAVVFALRHEVDVWLETRVAARHPLATRLAG